MRLARMVCVCMCVCARVYVAGMARKQGGDMKG